VPHHHLSQGEQLVPCDQLVNGHVELLCVGGPLVCGLMDTGSPGCADVVSPGWVVSPAGITLLPASASARRWLSPFGGDEVGVMLRSSRSTVAVASVLGMIESNPSGCRLLETASARLS